MSQETLPTALAVGLGAGCGAVARYLIVAAAPDAWAALLLTFAVNIAGCFAMGWLRPGPVLGTGFLGGLTTYSAVMLAAMRASIAGALAIAALSYATSLAAWFAGDAVRDRRG